LALPPQDRERGELLGPTRDLLVSGSGKVVGAVKKPLKGLGSLVFREGRETPPPSEASTNQDEGQLTRDREEDAAVRLANAEIERAERAEREQRGETLEMLVQMFPGMILWYYTYEDLDKEVVEAIIDAKDGRIGVCIDICLEMSYGVQTPTEREEGPRQHSEDGAASQDERIRRISDEPVDLLGIGGQDGIRRLTLEESENRGKTLSGVVDLLD
jgi:hypothetical protein